MTFLSRRRAINRPKKTLFPSYHGNRATFFSKKFFLVGIILWHNLVSIFICKTSQKNLGLFQPDKVYEYFNLRFIMIKSTVFSITTYECDTSEIRVLRMRYQYYEWDTNEIRMRYEYYEWDTNEIRVRYEYYEWDTNEIRVRYEYYKWDTNEIRVLRVRYESNTNMGMRKAFFNGYIWWKFMIFEIIID